MEHKEKNYMVCYVAGTQEFGKIGVGIHSFMGVVGEKPSNGPPRQVVTTRGYDLRKNRINDTDLEVTAYFDEAKYSHNFSRETQAEIVGILNAIGLATEERIDVLTINVDSDFMRRLIEEWIPSYINNHWTKPDGGMVYDKKLLQKLHGDIEKFRQTNELTFQFDTGSSQLSGHEKAKVLAGVAVNLNKNKEPIFRCKVPESGVDVYHKNDTVRNPLLCHSFVIASSHQAGSEATYHMASPGPDIYNIGRNTNNTGYGVVILDHMDQTLGSVIKRFLKDALHGQYLCLINLQKVFHTQIAKEIMNHGTNALCRPRAHFLDYDFVYGSIGVATEVDPPNLVLRGVAYTSILEKKLHEFIDNKVDKFIDIIDVTEHFYVDGKFNKSIRAGGKMFKLPHPTIPIKKLGFILGTDMPSINDMGRMASKDTKVHMVTWHESPKIIRYAIIIRTSSGYGIYNNFTTNVIIVKVDTVNLHEDKE